MNKSLTPLATGISLIFLLIVSQGLLFKGVGTVSAQELVSLRSNRAIELALQNNEAVKKRKK